MQALLLSLDEQHGGVGAAEGAGGPSTEAGPSSSGSHPAAAQASRGDGHTSPSRGGSCGRADEGAVDAGHLSAGTGRTAAGAGAAAESTHPSASSATAVHPGSSAPEAADVPDAQLLAHAARLAERASAQQPSQASGSGIRGDLQSADSHNNASSADASAWPAAAAGSDATIAYVHTAASADSSVDSALCRVEGSMEAQADSGCGSSALADALAGARSWAVARPGTPSSRLASSNSSSQVSAPAGIGSQALAQALAAANGWGTPSAAQVAAAQQPPFLGMVTVQAAVHIQQPTIVPSMQPACRHQGAQAACAAAPSGPQACAAGSGDAGSADDATQAACGTEALPEAGGAALLLQPDGTSLLVLLTNPAAAAAMAAAVASAAEAILPPEAAHGGIAPAGLNGPGVPLYEINGEVHSQEQRDVLQTAITSDAVALTVFCSRGHAKRTGARSEAHHCLLQDAADRRLAAALAAADAALMQHSQAALSQQTMAVQSADEQYRCSVLAIWTWAAPTK